MFTNSKNVKINGGDFHVTYNARTRTSETAQIGKHNFISFICFHMSSFYTGIELLQEKIAPGAFHNSAERYDPPKCHARTREAILQEIMDWIEDIDRKTRFLWLYGPAGSGKSAIEQTIAELCYKMNFLAASFFFSRSIGGRNEKTSFITTLVDQLIASIPEIREHVGNALYNNPSLLSCSLEAQMDTLVIKPLKAAASSSTAGVDFMNPRPKVIVLDGLDECGDPESQRYILKVLLNSVSNQSVPFSFILASRPEQHIREAFDGKILRSLTTRLVLDDKYHPDDDIRIFLQTKFQDIKDRHPCRAHLPSSWPLDEEVERLVRKSSGQFIYASTVIKFIDSHRHWPPDRLDIIFGISPCGKTTPFAEMDSLYLHILASAPENIEKALEIFTILLFLHHQDLQLTPRFVESLLAFREGESFMILSDLHSIIAVPSMDEQGSTLRFFHASLGDFLTDYSRSGDAFFLDSGVSHRNIVNRIVTQLTKSASALTTFEKQALQSVFPEHCLKATPDPEFLSNLYDVDVTACPHRPWVTRTSHITQIFTEILDSVNANNKVPELLVWMQGQSHPDRKEDLFTHHLLAIDIWLYTELSAIKIQDHPNPQIIAHVRTAATLVDFPQFRDIRHVIPRILDLRPKHITEQYHGHTEDSERWETYIKYRQIISKFLTDRTRSGCLFVDQERYVNLAQYLLAFLSDDLGKIEKYDVDIPKAALLILPVIFSKAAPSNELELYLETHALRVNPQLRKRFPQENWNKLFSSSYQTCKLALTCGDPMLVPTTNPKPSTGIGTLLRPNGLDKMSKKVKGLFKFYKL